MKILIELYISFFQVGLFSIGGGLAALPLIQDQVTSVHKWMSLYEFADLVTIAQMTPGPIALNASTFVGTRMSGFLGAIIASFAAITPSIIIVSSLAFLYFRYKNLSIIRGILEGLRPAAVALIASAGASLFILAMWGTKGFSLKMENFNFISLLIFVFSLIILRKFKLNPIALILISGIVGGSIYLAIG